jgi:hypothetical protein
VIAAGNSVVPLWKDTFVIDNARHVAESAALGPVSVTAVATAVRDALKFIGIKAQL